MSTVDGVEVTGPMGPRFDRTVELAIATRRGESDGAVLFGAEERRR